MEAVFVLVVRGVLRVGGGGAFFKASPGNRRRQRWLEEEPQLGLSWGVCDVRGEESGSGRSIFFFLSFLQ